MTASCGDVHRVVRRPVRRRRPLAGLTSLAGRSWLGRASTYVRRPPYFDGIPRNRTGPRHLRGEGACRLGDSVTTDHISPAGVIKREAPAGAT